MRWLPEVESPMNCQEFDALWNELLDVETAGRTAHSPDAAADARGSFRA